MRFITSIAILLALILTSACSQNKEKSLSGKKAKIAFSDTIHEYGIIDFSSEGTCIFEFSNEGTGQLVLKNVKSTCGCTVPEWPREPISEGESASILVRYDTHRVGSFSKTVYVYSNAVNSPNRLLIKGRVRSTEDNNM